jgi:ATP-dependent Clp protease, protease subunit
MKPMWIIKQQAQSLDIYLYDDITADGEDWWTGEKIPSDTSASHVQQVLQNAGDVSAINVYINSYGGDVKEGLAIYNMLKRSTALKTVYIDGFACSIASVIAMVGDKVIMGANTLMMIHNASMGAWGTSADLRKAADDLEVINSASISSYKTKAGNKLDNKTLQSLLDAETWLTPEQCVQYGLADEIANKADPATEAATQRFEQAKQSMMAALQGKASPAVHVPPDKQKQKTNAEKLMAAFKKKMEV